jgi:predicted molibdopterin-dependent oxidoreductase YjgC
MARKNKAAPGSYQRLMHPMVRENGALRKATWEEALDVAVTGFRRNLAKGDNSVGIFSCSKATNEVNYLAAKLARVAFLNNHIDSCNRT